MLSRLTLLCAIFAVIKAKPVLDGLKEHSGHLNNAHKLEQVYAVFEKFIRHSTAIQQFGETRSLEAQRYLATLPPECAQVGLGIRDVTENLLLEYYKCDVIGIVEDFVDVGIYSAKYIYNTYRDSSIVLGDLLACTSAGLNPFTFVYCIVKAVEVVPAEIKDIIALAKDYEQNMDYLIPKIHKEIEHCFNKTSIDYDIYLNNVLEKANMCKNNIIS